MLDLVELKSGRQLLGRPPFASAAPRGGDLDETTWTAGYRGGWQCVTPNAGNACTVGGRRHGFHGRASVDPWELLDVKEDTARLCWRGHGLTVTRELLLERGGLAVTTSFTAQEPTPFVHVEHLSLGLEVLEPEAELRLPAGVAYELSETDGPVRPPADAPRWPDQRLADGTIERGDRWSVHDRGTRFAVLTKLPVGRAEVVNLRSGAGLRLEWDAEVLPHLWLWRDVRTAGGPWREQAEMLAVEPASVPHSLGLGEAVKQGQACWARPGAPWRSWLRIVPISA